MPIKDPIEKAERHRRYMKEVWYPKNKKKHIAYVKRRKGVLLEIVRGLRVECIRCGENHPACLDFHHKDPSTKSFPIGSIHGQGWGEARIRKETEKCDVLCSNCHRKEHWSQRK